MFSPVPGISWNGIFRPLPGPLGRLQTPSEKNAHCACRLGYAQAGTAGIAGRVSARIEGEQSMEFLSQNMQVIVAAAVALLVLLVVMLAWRTFSPRMSGRRGQRLGISEFYEIDKSRRLVLVRRDQTEHLLLIGGHSDVVVETGLAAPATAPAPGASRAAPRPPVFGDRKTPPLRSAGDQPPASREEPAS